MRRYTNRIICASCVGLLTSFTQSLASESSDETPDSITLTGVVRDFKERTEPDGHTDFEQRPVNGFGHYCKNIDEALGVDGKPVFIGNGKKLTSQFKDADGNPICWTLYEPSLGDDNGQFSQTDDGGIESSASFQQWYNDELGVNMSRTLDLQLDRGSDGSYTFDSNIASWCQSVGGFFPIEGQLFGNSEHFSGTPNRNFHFTFELHTEFTYDSDGAQVFTFRGDDDVWVFINGQLVIDVGGVHGAIEQTVDLDRLGLEDDEVYVLDFFFAERHRTQSNFRIQTNLLLETTKLPTVTAAYD